MRRSSSFAVNTNETLPSHHLYSLRVISGTSQSCIFIIQALKIPELLWVWAKFNTQSLCLIKK